MNFVYRLWALKDDGWKLVIHGKEWQCRFEAERWKGEIIDIDRKLI